MPQIAQPQCEQGLDKLLMAFSERCTSSVINITNFWKKQKMVSQGS